MELFYNRFGRKNAVLFVVFEFPEKIQRLSLWIISKNTEVLVIPFLWAFVSLKMQLAAKQNDFHKRNLEASQSRCSALLQDIFHPLEENVKQGVYSKPGGHCLFIQQRDELIAKYNQEPRKGIQVFLLLCISYGGHVCWGESSLKNQWRQTGRIIVVELN